MSEFEDLQRQLASNRKKRDAVALAVSTQRARLERIERELGQAARAADEQRRARLETEHRALSAELAKTRREFASVRGDVAGLLADFSALSDPTQQVERWSDRTPIVFFPVRLETRFHSSTSSEGEAVRELWIRVYPDDCQVDTFEPLLRDSEIDSLRSFWIATFRAGGIEAQERGAWSALVGSLGSGRAEYAISEFAPSNLGAKPTKPRPEDIVLVIAPSIELTPTEQGAAFAYWVAVWAADGNAQEEALAKSALGGAVGALRADEIIADFAPDPNGWDPPTPFSRADVTASCAVLVLPPAPVTTQSSWTRAPTATTLPDRFVALLFNGDKPAHPPVVGAPIPDPLAVAPDPTLSVDEQIGVSDDDLALNDDLVWLADFERAVQVGMGFKIPLTSTELGTGFDRLLVLGLRLSADATDSKLALEALIQHQHASKGGYGFVPQGSPTNNTESAAAAHTWVDDPDASFDRVFKRAEAYTESTDPLVRRDGEWFARALGIDGEFVKRLPHAAGTDQAEARAMNIALYNGTLGYALEELFQPLVTHADIGQTRLFFTRFVSGRGPLPAVRVGRQPYGLLPALAFSRYRSTRGQRTEADYLSRLHQLLSRMARDWRSMSSDAAHVGKAGNPHQILLDIVGLHPGSVEYHQRYARSLDQFYNQLTLSGGSAWGSLLSAWVAARGRQLLERLGADPEASPPILDKLFYGTSTLLNGPVVDDVPLSESVGVRSYTPDGKNYIEWLATSSLDVIRRQDFGGEPEPLALLYLMLRHALLLGQWDAGLRFLEGQGLIDSQVARLEPAFIHVEAQGGGQSKFEPLIRTAPAVTGDATTTIAEHILRPGVLASAPETEDLREIVAALEHLRDIPTARLERLFAEHVDTVSYRLDAWKTGLAAARLAELRPDANDDEAQGGGVFLGAYGWLEEVRPKPNRLRPVRLNPELASVFQRRHDAPLRQEPTNAGFIHAPSLQHAATAAILKNAYRANASSANPDVMAVNLTSARVRQALTLLEGIRNGQSLAALLGYRFERGLHDEHSLAEVDKFIYPLRQVFPLVANQLEATQTESDITLVEARNVINGQKLIERVLTPARRQYPFGFPLGSGPGRLLPANIKEREAIDREVDRLLDLNDALGDLVLSESVFQVVGGNFERSAATTNALLQGGHPPDPEVVKTPRSGLALEHRVGLHFDPSVPLTSPSSVPMTPRATAEAPLNRWLATRLPAPSDVVVAVSYFAPSFATKHVTVSLEALALQPIDLVYLGDLELDQAMTELDDRIAQLVRFGADAHPGMQIEIAYTEPVPGKVTLFELAALVRSLRVIVLESRALQSTDLVRPLEAEVGQNVWDDAELSARVTVASNALTARRNSLTLLETDPAPLDAYARKVSTELLLTALHGMPGTGSGQIQGDIKAIYDAVANKIEAAVERLEARALDYQASMDTWPTLTDEPSRFAMLKRAELYIMASGTLVPPVLALDYKTLIEGEKLAFDADLAQIKALRSWNGTALADFTAAVSAVAPLVNQHDPTPFAIDDQLNAMVTLRDVIASRVTTLGTELTRRIDEANALITTAATSSDVDARIQQLLEASKLVLGDEMRLIPHFQIPVQQQSELAQCLAASPALLTDLVASGRRFPVDDWLYGVARVRSKLAAWENASVLSEAFGGAPAELTPLQLPFLANDRWVALEFDTEAAPALDRMLYTAHFAAPLDPTKPQCGLLLDAWPEIVPAPNVTSGLTVHFDRPNAQPPQAMLLAVPPVLRGHWTFDDLVATLNETLDGAKDRAVEPAQVDASAYAQLLPATIMTVTLYGVTINTNLAQNIHIYELIGGS